jgi:hypothetical protein
VAAAVEKVRGAELVVRAWSGPTNLRRAEISRGRLVQGKSHGFGLSPLVSTGLTWTSLAREDWTQGTLCSCV